MLLYLHLTKIVCFWLFRYLVSMYAPCRMSLSKVLNAAAHGHIHETVGGSWNHYFGEEAEGVDVERDDSVMTFAHEIQASTQSAAAWMFSMWSRRR